MTKQGGSNMQVRIRDSLSDIYAGSEVDNSHEECKCTMKETRATKPRQTHAICVVLIFNLTMLYYTKRLKCPSGFQKP